MVQKSKGGKKCRSVQAGKKAKNKMKHNRKTNYKKGVVKKVECCVCMEEIPDTSDNTITCGKVNHALCGECKMKCEDCPMCRSHKVHKPKSQDVNMRIFHRGSKLLSIEKLVVKGAKVEKYDSSDSSLSFPVFSGDGIYEKYGEDKEGNSIYKHEYLELYIYQNNICYGWILDDKYQPDTPAPYIVTSSEKLLGKIKWYPMGCGPPNNFSITVRIKKVK